MKKLFASFRSHFNSTIHFHTIWLNSLLIYSSFSKTVAHICWVVINCIYLYSQDSNYWLDIFKKKCLLSLLSVSASSQQCSSRCPAGRLRDSGPSSNATQPGHPVRIPGKIWGGSTTVQTGEGAAGKKYENPVFKSKEKQKTYAWWNVSTGFGRPGEVLRPHPPRCSHHAKYTGTGVQVGSVTPG